MQDHIPMAPTVHSMLRRLHGWDYRQRAIYQITITLATRSSCTLGRLEVRHQGGDGAWWPVEALKGQPSHPEGLTARVVANALGEAVGAALDEMPRRFPQVVILKRQLMPDHVHFIIFVRAPLEKPLGALVRGFKAGACKRWKGLSTPENGLAQNGRDAALATAVSRPVPTNSFVGFPAWSEGFQDTILFREGQLANMKHYLADNPRRLAIKRLFPDLFRVVGELTVDLQLPKGQQGRGRFSALGNRFLLERPLVQVQVSRRDFGYRREAKLGGGQKIARDAQGEPIIDFETTVYSEKKATLFAAARHGAVLISPCVSDGERQIAHEALRAGFPLITLLNKGFSPLQKPAGRFFDACAEGRLLMLAPAAWPYQPGEKPMTRVDATAMNRLCQWIVGEDAAEINYHGMRPENIDALAITAARVQLESD